MSARPTPLPAALEVRELLTSLVGRDFEALTGAAMVDPSAPGGAVVAEYVDDAMRLAALIVADLPLAAGAGAAIALLPPAGVSESVSLGEISIAQFENFSEILNVLASLFNGEGAPHLKLSAVHAPGQALPTDVAPWVMSYVARLDLELSVQGYGVGTISILVLGH